MSSSDDKLTLEEATARLDAVLAIHTDGASYNDCITCSFDLSESCRTRQAALGLPLDDPR